MTDLEYWLRRMREDWDRRALEDAEHFIHTTDSESTCTGFEESGQANYNQLVRPFLPLYLAGRNPKCCSGVEIGCGIGRMTRYFAQDFGSIHAFDVSPQMLDKARQRLQQISNVHFHVSRGAELEAVADGSTHLVFSYLVFQHCPSAEVVKHYVSEAERVLKAGGIFKFQVNGHPASQTLQHDTWQGVSFSADEIGLLLRQKGFSIVSQEGLETQYLVVTARKGEGFCETRIRPYILPGETWASEQLLSGWGPCVQQSWRPLAPLSQACLHLPQSRPLRLYAGIYFWPTESHCGRKIEFLQDGCALAKAPIEQSGDHFFCFDNPRGPNQPNLATIEMRIDPPCRKAPAARILGVY